MKKLGPMKKLTGITALALGASLFALNITIDTAPESRSGVSTDPAAIVADSLLGRGSLCAGRLNAAANPGLRVKFAQAYAYDGDPKAPATDGMPPLFEGFGDISFPISSKVPEAQAYFDQGLKMAYDFNHYEALRAFKAAQKADPFCAICAWGEALVLGPNINAPMDPAAVAPAFDAVSRARALADTANARERALITALAERYSPDPTADRVMLDQAYAKAMLTVARVYSDDDNILTLAAEAVMDTQPWDYWEADGLTAKGQADQAIALIDTVLERNPNHIGAIHMVIHLKEASTDPRAALSPAERLADLAPAAGHLVHMPSHIFHRIGMYRESLEHNVRAVEAHERYLAQADEQGFVRFGYYPHNVHFVLVSAQALGDRETTLDAGKKLEPLVPAEVLRTALWAQAIVSAPMLAEVQFQDYTSLLARPQPAEEFPYIVALWHYSRAMAFAGRGELDAARVEAEAIARMQNMPGTVLEDLEAGGLPVRPVMKIAEAVIRGQIARLEGDLEAAAGHFEAGAAIQVQIPYMEPPYWYYPVSQSLGAVLLEAGKLEEAEAAFRQALAVAPDNGWSLYGLMTTYERMGKSAVADRIQSQFDRTWAGRTPPKIRDL